MEEERKIEMKRIFAIVMVLLMMVSPVMACPAWECNYGLDDYSCGGYHGGCTDSWGCDYQYDTDECYGESSYVYDEYSYERQPLYCQYCGNESWACTCGTGSNYDCNYNYDCGYEYQQDSYGYGYDCGYQETYYDTGYCSGYSYSGESMNHWANIRDCFGNVIGQVGAGSSVEVVGTDCSNPDRVYIYDYSTGCYGSVLSECVYGNYQWDGTGDNGCYNSYQGGGCGYYEDYGYDTGCTGNTGYDCGYYEGGYDCGSGYTDCGYSYDDGNCGVGYGIGAGCNAYSQSYYVTYCETVVQRCVTYGIGGMSGLGCRI